MNIDLNGVLDNAADDVEDIKHYNYSNVICGTELELRKRYEPDDNNLKFYNLALAGNLKDRLLILTKNWNKELEVSAAFLAGFSLEVGINRAYTLLEETGSIDSILNKVSDSKKSSNCKRGRQ